MATTLTASNLVIAINEQITLNGNEINSSNNLTIANINEVDKRIVTVPITEVTVMIFSTSVAAGQYIGANVKYLRITNKDDTNFCRIRVTQTDGQTFDIKLEAAKTFIMGNISESANTDGSAFVDFVSADNISAQADTAPVDLELFVAST